MPRTSPHPSPEELGALADRLAPLLPDPASIDFASLRLVQDRGESLSVRRGIPQPVSADLSTGVMVSVFHGGGYGYAATADLSEKGVRAAIDTATAWARATAATCVDLGSREGFPKPEGTYHSPVEIPWDTVPLGDKLAFLAEQSERLKVHDDIVHWETILWYVRQTTALRTNAGGSSLQTLDFVSPGLEVVASRDGLTQTRSLRAGDRSQQGGYEVLDRIDYRGFPERFAREVLELLEAPNCPSGTMDVVLSPDQMMLQIHESIGHPLELDRILGDERNYAGTSFVTTDMFGSYQYGSELLNVSFDPTRTEQFASYGFDDEGDTAEKVFIIKDGVLERPLGGLVSRARTGLEGTANTRATSWNRPPIDRMANLNVEAGTSTRDEIIGSVERGIYMETNCSWSIDDSRNKFQFGCELGRVIEEGQLKGLVRNPNYRGISATFWRNLAGVGAADTVGVHGTPYCGKGEPNQVIRVGHASPLCRFTNIDVFGGV